jgi:rhodanese-related sulfurtransferase
MDSSYVTALLNMMGFEAYSLKFGMSYYLPGNGSDHELAGAEDLWTDYVSDTGIDSEYWVFDEESPEVPVYDGYPTLNTGKTTGPEILRDRVEYALDRGADPLMFDDIKGNLADYNILNWWKTSYDGLTGNPYQVFGHLLGAVQFPPSEYKLVMDGGLTAVDPDRPNIIYCFTGQTSGLAEAYLVVLGYDVHGLAYGANSVVWSKMVNDAGKGMNRWPKPYGE